MPEKFFKSSQKDSEKVVSISKTCAYFKSKSLTKRGEKLAKIYYEFSYWIR